MTGSDAGWVRAHTGDEDEWSRWQSDFVQQVDFAIHIHYLHEYLTEGMRILEVGAGAGRFTKELASISNRITVVDISPTKIQRNKRNVQAMGYAAAIEAWHECDMCDLTCIDDGQYDAVVCVGGPLSYVFDRRAKAIGELMRVTKRGGRLILSAKSLWGTVHESLPRILQVDPRMNREIVATGDMGPTQVAVASSFWHAYRADEFRLFIEQAGARVDLMSASDCLSATWAEILSTWRDDEKRWQHLLELEIEACRQPGCLDMGTHILAVATRSR